MFYGSFRLWSMVEQGKGITSQRIILIGMFTVDTRLSLEMEDLIDVLSIKVAIHVL